MVVFHAPTKYNFLPHMGLLLRSDDSSLFTFYSNAIAPQKTKLIVQGIVEVWIRVLSNFLFHEADNIRWSMLHFHHSIDRSQNVLECVSGVAIPILSSRFKHECCQYYIHFSRWFLKSQNIWISLCGFAVSLS